MQQRAESGELAFGTVDSWLIHKLTGGARTSSTRRTRRVRCCTTCARRALGRPHAQRAQHPPAAMMPSVVDSSGVAAETDASLFGRALPIAGIAGDQQAALYGQGCFEAGSAKNTYGTGCFILQHTGDHPVFAKRPPDHGRVAHRRQAALRRRRQRLHRGRGVQWLRDGLGIIKSAADSEALAGSVASSDGVYVVPAFAGLGAPHWGHVRARHDRRHHARHDRGAHHARDARIDRAADARRRRADGARDRRPHARTARRWRRGRERPADADSGRRPAAPCRTLRHGRDDGAGRGVSRGLGRRLLARRGGDREDLAQWRYVRAAHARAAARHARHRWRRAVERAKGWAAGDAPADSAS